MPARITQNRIYDDLSLRIQTSTAKLVAAQEQLSTGRRVNRPSDDPPAMVRILGLRDDIDRLDQFSRNANEAKGRLDAAASALTSLSDLLNQARALGVQGANGTVSSTDRKIIASELDVIVDQAVEIANSQFGRRFLFAGTDAEIAPYVENTDGPITRIEFQGRDAETRIPISPGLDVAADLPGLRIFGGQDRGDTKFTGDTGAAAGAGTDSGTGRGVLSFAHTATNVGDGLGVGGGDSASGVAAGASSPSGDTILGTHSLILTVDATGTSGTVSLDGGTAVAFTSATAADFGVTNAVGDRVSLNLSGVTAGFTGTVGLVGQGTVSIDGGATSAAIDFSTAQVVSDSLTGEVTHVDSSAIQRTGDEAVDYEGTFDIFSTLIALRDEMLADDGTRPPDEVSTAIARRVATLVGAHDDVLLGVGTLGARSARLDVSSNRLQDLKLKLQVIRSDLEDIDIAEAVLELQQRENAFQASLAVGARLGQQTLLNYL